MDNLEPDEMLVLRQYKELKRQLHGDLDISVKDGKLVKLWTVDKIDLSILENRQMPKGNFVSGPC